MWREVRDSAAAADAVLAFPNVGHRVLHGLEFSAALPQHFTVAAVAARLADFDGARAVLQEPVALRPGRAR